MQLAHVDRGYLTDRWVQWCTLTHCPNYEQNKPLSSLAIAFFIILQNTFLKLHKYYKINIEIQKIGHIIYEKPHFLKDTIYTSRALPFLVYFL